MIIVRSLRELLAEDVARMRASVAPIDPVTAGYVIRMSFAAYDELVEEFNGAEGPYTIDNMAIIRDADILGHEWVIRDPVIQ